MKYLIPGLIVLLCGCQQQHKNEVVNDNNSEPKVNSIKPMAPEGMIYIPSGSYDMGGKSDQAYHDEFPVHFVEVSAFYMDQTEVTNRQFSEFIDATGYVTIAERDVDWEVMKAQLPEGTPRPADSLMKAGSLTFKQTATPVNLNDYSQWWQWTIGANWRHPEGPKSSIEDKMDHPVVHVAWEDAVAYAEWAGKRLPTEAEWEWASMGGDTGSKYPWGNESPSNATDKANFWQGVFPHKNHVLDGYATTAPVKSFPPNGFGLYEMGGNVWEFCLDKYDVDWYEQAHKNGKLKDPKGSDRYFDPNYPFEQKHVIRGGSFLCNDSYCSGYRVARRMSTTKDSGFNHTGFRCVKDI